MKTDEEIEAERAAMEPVVGPTRAWWYDEACRVEYGDPALLWACRCREMLRVYARDHGELALAVRRLTAACSRLDEGGGDRVREAAAAAESLLWWDERPVTP